MSLIYGSGIKAIDPAGGLQKLRVSLVTCGGILVISAFSGSRKKTALFYGEVPGGNSSCSGTVQLEPITETNVAADFTARKLT